jgi:hypothetical protein
MKYAQILLLMFVGFKIYAMDKYEEIMFEWGDYRTYFVKNRDFTNYHVATYLIKTKELQVYYQANIIENYDNQMRIYAHGAVCWGPKSSEWIADSFLIIKRTQMVHVVDDATEKHISGKILKLASTDNDEIIGSIRNGIPAVHF